MYKFNAKCNSFSVKTMYIFPLYDVIIRYESVFYQFFYSRIDTSRYKIKLLQHTIMKHY